MYKAERRAKKGSKKSFHWRLYHSIQKALEELKRNPTIGNTISYKDWNRILKKAALPNLFKIDLIEGWRMWYYIKSNKIVITCFILGYGDHKKYMRDVYGK